MLWAYIELLQSYRRPKRPLDYVAFIAAGMVGGIAIGGFAVGGAVGLMKITGSPLFAKLVGGFSGMVIGWVFLLILNVQLFRLVDWVYDSKN